MNQKYIMLIFLLIINNNVLTNSQTAPKATRKQNTVTPAFAYPIKPSDLNHNVNTGAAMYTINNPGCYYISQDLVPKFQSGKTGVTVINITASNVTLNLNNKAIRPSSNSDTTGTGHVAIGIANNLHNITIMNGNVIGANDSSLIIDTGINLGSGLKSVNLLDLNLSQFKAYGIIASNANGIKIKNSSVRNCAASSTSAGLFANTCNDLEVLNCDFDNNDTTTGYAHGIYLIDCTNGYFENVSASSNNSTATTTAAAHGIRLATNATGCANLSFKDIMAVGNTVTGNNGGHSYGIKLEANTKNCLFQQINATGNGDPLNSTNAYGLYAITSQSCNFNDVAFSGNSALTTAAGVYLIDCFDFNFNNGNSSNHTAANSYGYKLTSATTGCKGCNFNNCGTVNNVSSAGEAAGFSISNSTSNHYRNCYSNNNSATGGQCSGWRFTTGSNGQYLENCEALNNSGSNNVYGFSFETVNSNKAVYSRANENNSSGGVVAGFNFTSALSNTITNCEANHNIAANGASNAYGFTLTNSSYNHFAQCYAATCTAQTANKIAAGFASNAGVGNHFLECKSIGQTCSGTGTLLAGAILQYACGFLLQNSENGARLENCKADNNNGGSGEGVGFGIYLQGSNILTATNDTTAPINTTILNCAMSFNTSSGSSTTTQGNKYGFFDNHQNTTSVLINNVSTGHGRCIATINSGLSFVDPVTGSSGNNGMNFMFYHNGIDENPANMIHETDIFNWTTLSTSVPNWMNLSIVTAQLAVIF